jgi:hypothetical protein
MLRWVAGGASLLIALALAGSGLGGDGEHEPRASFTLEQARAFDEFPLYDAGDPVDGLPLVAVLRRDDTARYVTFVYGDCAPGDDAGCAPPAEIQIWPACRRNLALYGASSPEGPSGERTTIRGVPALSLDEGTRLEIQTGRSIVVVFADSRARALRVAGALRAVNGSVPAGEPLPQPAPGALEGTLVC